jgi:Uma2 family endonuclease
VPDRGYHRGRPTGIWIATAAVVVEIVSPDDETYKKFGFYARHEVDELLVVDPAGRALSFWTRISAERYEPAPASSLLKVTAAELVVAISWPDPSE